MINITQHTSFSLIFHSKHVFAKYYWILRVDLVLVCERLKAGFSTDQPSWPKMIGFVISVDPCDFHDIEFSSREADNSSLLSRASREFGRATRIEKTDSFWRIVWHKVIDAPSSISLFAVVHLVFDRGICTCRDFSLNFWNRP